MTRNIELHDQTSTEPQTFSDLPDAISMQPALAYLGDVELPSPLKPPVEIEDLEHRAFDSERFWTSIPAYANVDEETFLDPGFQARNSVKDAAGLRELVGEITNPDFLDDVERGLAQAPMNIRITPYLLSRVDWENPYDDPIRIQFLPVASSRRPEHPMMSLDSLHEQDDSPTPGLVHRYPDKALFLPLDVCPVYCRYCTRSYAIGGSTEAVDKAGYRPNSSRWQAAMAYVASRPEIEDIVVSGGDAFMLSAKKLEAIMETLLAIPHVRRVRVATKGPAVMPMKILRDEAWTDVLARMTERGRKLHKEVCLHTHFNCIEEISDISRRAMNLLFEKGVKVRNQSVLVSGVNDDPDAMVTLLRKLSYMNVQPYYVYQHDMVKGVEDLRTTLGETMEIERHVRGATAGFNTPTFVTDVPGGGGKRDLHSCDAYDDVTGVSVYRSPVVDDNTAYLYFDPIHLLPEEGRRRWADPREHTRMIKEALLAAGLSGYKIATA